MSTENPILDALEVSVIINRKDVLNQRFWTEWRAGIAVTCPAHPGDLVMLGPLGTIDPCLLPPIGASINKVMAIIDFVNADGPEDTTASVTVTGLTWVTVNSVIIAGFGGTTVDHGPDDAMAEDLSAYVENLVPGVGFDITAHAPLGTWGHYQVWALGAI